MNRLFASALLALGLVAILENANAAQQHVAAMGKRFSTSEVRIASKEMVIFINQDKVVHQVFSTTEGLRFNLKRLPPGAASGVRFTKRGVAEVRCAIHRDMHMKVVVE
ncbi:MAG TPA: plastocyanin/azurin family copper-binding protein [Gemmatimonadaceae bacterium]|nr:plastocyanin/azurin family copper-binding protein [Gemmatimonadaceae bacterium]